MTQEKIISRENMAFKAASASLVVKLFPKNGTGFTSVTCVVTGTSSSMLLLSQWSLLSPTHEMYL